MNFPVNLALFENNRHSPSFLGLKKSMGAQEEKELHDFCIPVNPYFPTPEMFESFRGRLEKILKYYPAYNESITEVLCKTLDLDPETVVLGNGSTELITWINRLFVKSLAIPIPTFSRWTDDPMSTGKAVHLFPRLPEQDFQLDVRGFISFIHQTGARAAVICNPNNPTGAFLPVSEVLRLIDALRDLDVVVIDESFADFVEETEIPSVAREVVSRPNAIVLKSLGKNFGLHGVRAGFAVAHPDLAAKLRQALPYWNLNAMAEMLIRDLGDHMEEYELGRRQVVRDRMYLERSLGTVPGLRVFPSKANFVYFRVPDEIDGVELRNRLLTEHGLLTRECGNKVGSDSQHFRVAARPREETDLLVRAIGAAMKDLSY